MRSAVIECIAVLLNGNVHSLSLGLRNDRREFAYGLIDTQPEFSSVEICHHRGHSAEVVGMRMRDDDHVQMIDASIPKIRRDHLFTDIEIRMHPLWNASGIDEQRAAFGRDQ